MPPVLTPSDFVALVNQTLEFAYPVVVVEGEVLNFKVSRNRWVYFDIADEGAKVRCFGTVYQLPAPVEDGMIVRISANGRLHPQFGFSLNVSSLQFAGEGTIKKASDLLMQQLEKEGLFAPERKRSLPYPPETIGLITSDESAAYKDFIKVLDARWGGVHIELANVQVQGDVAVTQISRAIEWFSRQADIPDVLVIIRGGGSADDLQAFSSEQVTRAVAASRIPTLVAIGHEQDISLAELAADLRASTPSNAAELLVPDRRERQARLAQLRDDLHAAAERLVDDASVHIIDVIQELHSKVLDLVETQEAALLTANRTLAALSPQATLNRGYAIVRKDKQVVRTGKSLRSGDELVVTFADGTAMAKVQ